MNINHNRFNSFAPNTSASASAKPAVQPEPAVTVQPEPAKHAVSRQMAVRFSPPSYPGKADANGNIARPYRAAGTIVGLFGTLPIQIGGFQLQQNGTEMIVHFPFTSKTFSGVPAISPETRHVDDDMRKMAAERGLDLGDRVTMPVAGGAAAVEALEQALRDAWVECQKGGQTRWNTEIPLKLSL